jgi:signal transduction histidine kinase
MSGTDVLQPRFGAGHGLRHRGTPQVPGSSALPRDARLLILSVVLAGAAIVAVSVPEAAHWSRHDLLVFLALAGAAAIAQQFTIPIRHGGETENLDMTDGVWAAGLLLAQPSAITFAVVAGICAGQAARRWSAHKIAFNVGQDLVGITGALFVYETLGTAADEPQSWFAAGLGMAVYFLVNAGTVALVISLVEQKPYRSVLLPSAGLNLLQWSANVALGILVAIVIVTEPAALPLLSVPLLLSYFTYRGWLREVRNREFMQELAQTADAIYQQGDLARRVAGAGEHEADQVAATLNRMLDRVDAAFRRERRFISEASHELRTPITICRGHLEVLGPNPSVEEVEDSVALVVDELGRMGRLVDDMTTLARADTKGFLRPERIPLDRFLADVASKAAPLLDDRLCVVPPARTATLEGDPQRLTQALINLLQNAVLHGLDGSPIVLSVLEESDSWRFEVADEGGGITLDPPERAFEPFSSARTGQGGSGLGLAIVLTIAKAHGGAAGVRNRPGEGATFWIRVPKCDCS